MTFTDVETARKNYHEKSKKYLSISAAIAILLGLLTGITGQAVMLYGIVFGVVIFSLGAGITIFLTRKEAVLYRKAYKGYFVEQNLKKIFTDLTYNHQSGIGAALLSNTGMVNTGDVYSSNDLTIARYKDTSFMQADVHIQTESTDSDGDTTYVTIFKGRFMIFEFPKKFNFKLELVGKRFRAYRVPGKDKTTGRQMVKIQTESTEFNHTFKIFGQDGFETFYILDPALIVKIQAIAERYKNKILFGFYDNKMLVGIDDGKDSFEPPRPFKPINEKQEMQKVASEIKVITDFVDAIS